MRTAISGRVVDSHQDQWAASALPAPSAAAYAQPYAHRARMVSSNGVHMSIPRPQVALFRWARSLGSAGATVQLNILNHVVSAHATIMAANAQLMPFFYHRRPCQHLPSTSLLCYSLSSCNLSGERHGHHSGFQCLEVTQKSL